MKVASQLATAAGNNRPGEVAESSQSGLCQSNLSKSKGAGSASFAADS